jgi:hypothetical protein
MEGCDPLDVRLELSNLRSLEPTAPGNAISRRPSLELAERRKLRLVQRDDELAA